LETGILKVFSSPANTLFGMTLEIDGLRVGGRVVVVVVVVEVVVVVVVVVGVGSAHFMIKRPVVPEISLARACAALAAIDTTPLANAAVPPTAQAV
jgi:hypothetical protein